MIGAQTILKASQAVRTVAPTRSLTIMAGPPKNKVSRAEFMAICGIFTVANFSYPVYVLYSLSERRRQK